jgi:hypothetical protein
VRAQVLHHLGGGAVGGLALAAPDHGLDDQRQRIGPLLGLREVFGRQAEHVADHANRQRLRQRRHQVEGGAALGGQRGEQLGRDRRHPRAQRLHHGGLKAGVHQAAQPRVHRRIVEQHPALAGALEHRVGDVGAQLARSRGAASPRG